MHAETKICRGPGRCTRPAEGWIATARFGKGGIRYGGSGPCLTIHAINPERGTDWSVEGRTKLLRRAIDVQKVAHQDSKDETTIFLTSAGFFGCCTARGRSASPSEVWWMPHFEKDVHDLRSTLMRWTEGLPHSTHLAIGVDGSGHAQEQELWWFQGGGSGEKLRVRTHKAEPLAAGPFTVLPFVCGAIWGSHGVELRIKDLADVDVVLDAGHASLNRVWKTLVPRGCKRWAFQRTIARIRNYCGAVFAHAHGGESKYVRNCDNWVVFRDELPFPDITGIPIP